MCTEYRDCLLDVLFPHLLPLITCVFCANGDALGAHAKALNSARSPNIFTFEIVAKTTDPRTKRHDIKGTACEQKRDDRSVWIRRRRRIQSGKIN